MVKFSPYLQRGQGRRAGESRKGCRRSKTRLPRVTEPCACVHMHSNIPKTRAEKEKVRKKPVFVHECVKTQHVQTETQEEPE